MVRHLTEERQQEFDQGRQNGVSNNLEACLGFLFIRFEVQVWCS